jgi:hypothetical protein
MKSVLCFCGPTRSVSSAMFSASLLLSALAITGCGGMASMPDTITSTPSATPNPIQGSVFGGHAPIVGSHVYILQAGTGGYASAPTNLMTSGSAGSDAHGNYALTAADGSFNVSGDYTCTVGMPVYIAATGGATSTNIGGPNYNTAPINIASATATFDPLLGEYALTFTGNNLLYPGQFVVFTFPLTSPWAVLNGGTKQVATATTSTFTIAFPSNIAGTSTGSAQPQSAVNPAIANLAVLGNCPSTGNFSTSGTGSDVISYVYINEVSTAALAYAFAGFGSGPFNIGYPSGDTLAKTGIQNAANNAAALYDIEGAYISTTFAGEGHIANPTTPAGNGIAPQATMDTLGNIIASCVDSWNLTSSATNPDVGGASDSCSTLFTYATSNGVPYGAPSGVGTIATDTATAAFNIAHNPAGNTTYSAVFMEGIYSLQAAQETPFSPNLASQPNDFTVAIQYTAALNPGPAVDPSLIEGPQAVAVDASGNFWFTTKPGLLFTSGYLVEDSPAGVKLYDNLNSAWTYGDVAIDSNGDAWTGNQGNYVLATEVVPPVAPSTTYTLKLQGSNYTYAQGLTADGTGHVYVPHGPTLPPPASTDNDQTLSELDTAGVVTPGTTGNMAASFPPGAFMTHAAFDSSRDIWFTSNNGNVIARVNSATGAAITGFPINTSTSTAGCPSGTASTILSPEQPAIDASGNAWVPIYNAGSGSTVIKVTTAGACTAFPVGTGPYGAAVDGANNLWVTNNGGGGVGAGSVTEISTATGTAISPSSNYTVGGLLSGPQGLAVDLSGDLIITNFTGDSIVEVIGVATPTYLPLGVAAANGKLGATP